MKVGAPLQFRPSDYPDMPAGFLDALNRTFQDVYDTFRSIPEVVQLSGRRFSTDSNGDATVDIKNPLSNAPTSVVVDQVREESGSPIVDPWAFSFEMASDVVRLKFVGLIPDSTFQLTVSLK